MATELVKYHDYNTATSHGQLYILDGSIDDHFTLDPIQYRAKR